MSTAPGSVAAAVLECASCRRPLRPDARFCTACGTPVEHDVTVTVVEGAQARSRGSRAAARREPQPGVLHPAFGDAVPAGAGRRVLAYAVDAVAVAAVAGLLLATTGSGVLAALTVVELALGIVVWEAHTGRTLGNTVLGLRTAREETPYSVGPARGFLRALVLAAGHAAAGLGQWVVVASGAWDRSGRVQAWHDRVGRAVVVDVRAHERAVDERAAAAADVVSGEAPAARPGGQLHGGPGAGAPAVAGAGAATGGHGAPTGTGVPTQAGAAAVAPPAAAAPQGPVPAAGAHGPDPAAAFPAGAGRRALRAEAGTAPADAPVAADAGPAAPGWTGVRPVVPAAAVPEPPTPAPVVHQEVAAPFLVTLDTGQAMTVTGPGLIGRAPRPVAGERCDHVIVIEDPERSVSRTHARFGIEAGTFWVSDAGSGNGTSLRLPGGRVVPVPGDQRMPVPSGSSILVGDRSVRIDAPQA